MSCDHYSLHESIIRNKIDLTRRLLQYVDINQKDSWDRTPLCVAIQYNKINIVKLLLENGADPEITQDDDCCIHVAVRTSSLEIFKMLLEYRANLNCRTDFGSHSIHLAADYGRLDFLKYLINLGISINLTDNYKRTPLHRAVASGGVKTVQFLIQHNANVNKKDKHGNIPLHMSIQRGYKIITDMLISSGSRLDERNCNKWTPLYLAIRYRHFEIFKTLYESGAKCSITGKCGRYSALHLAAETGNFEIIFYFLSKGADANFQTVHGFTLLHAAVRSNHTGLISFLIYNGADINMTTVSKGYNALDFAAQAGNPDVINLLIQNRANFEFKSNGECRILRLLLKESSFYCLSCRQHDFKVAAEIIIRFLAIRNRHAPPFFPPNFLFLDELNNYWIGCKQELEKMDTYYVGNSGISQYELLQATFFSDMQLARYLNNEEIAEFCLNLPTNLKVSTIYFKNIEVLMQIGFERGVLRNKLVNYADSIIGEISKKLPPEIRMKIINFLSTESLIKLKEA